jgi:predicted CXXCH cytochrome family protein
MLSALKGHVRVSAKRAAAGLLAVLASFALPGCPGGNAGYVGMDACLGCHDGRYAPDRTGVKENGHAEVGCEACHGPGYLHVRNGGRNGLFIGVPANYDFCAKCHEEDANGFAESKHGVEGLFSCDECHDVHAPERTRASFKNNDLCLQCHVLRGFVSEAAIASHTLHDVDPEGTGASRCTSCHMPPLGRVDQARGPHSHSLWPIPPIASNEAAAAGVTPVPPNSCSGAAGCHDGSVATAPVFDVDNPDDNAVLQLLYDSRHGT